MKKYVKAYDNSLIIRLKNQYEFGRAIRLNTTNNSTILLDAIPYGKNYGFDPEVFDTAILGSKNSIKGHIWNYVER